MTTYKGVGETKQCTPRTPTTLQMMRKSIKGSALTKVCHIWKKGTFKFPADYWFASVVPDGTARTRHEPGVLQQLINSAKKAKRRWQKPAWSPGPKAPHTTIVSPPSTRPPWHTTTSTFIVSRPLPNRSFNQAWKSPETEESGLTKSNESCLQPP